MRGGSGPMYGSNPAELGEAQGTTQKPDHEEWGKTGGQVTLKELYRGMPHRCGV